MLESFLQMSDQLTSFANCNTGLRRFRFLGIFILCRLGISTSNFRNGRRSMDQSTHSSLGRKSWLFSPALKRSEICWISEVLSTATDKVSLGKKSWSFSDLTIAHRSLPRRRYSFGGQSNAHDALWSPMAHDQKDGMHRNCSYALCQPDALICQSFKPS